MVLTHWLSHCFNDALPSPCPALRNMDSVSIFLSSAFSIFWSFAFVNTLFYVFIFFSLRGKGERAATRLTICTLLSTLRSHFPPSPVELQACGQWKQVCRRLSTHGWSINNVISLLVIFYLTKHHSKIMLPHTMTHQLSLQHTIERGHTCIDN